MHASQEIHCRKFQNGDPPQLAALWQQAGEQRGLVPQMSTMTLESEVLAKPYFDPAGLILAELGDHAVGFVHAGFGPASDQPYHLDFDLGVICLVVVPQQNRQSEIEDHLIAAAESYLRECGAKVIYGGQMSPLNPFYFGLYGGSELGGVVATDEALHHALHRAGYQACSHSVLLERELPGFRPPLDRRLMQYRRQYHVTAESNPPTENWWQACLLANIERTRFLLTPRCGGPHLGAATYWNMEAASRVRGVTTSGLLSLEIESAARGQGLATFLVAESMRQLQENAVELIETQTMTENQAAQHIYEKLGFTIVDHGTVYRRPESPARSVAANAPPVN